MFLVLAFIPLARLVANIEGDYVPALGILPVAPLGVEGDSIGTAFAKLLTRFGILGLLVLICIHVWPRWLCMLENLKHRRSPSAMMCSTVSKDHQSVQMTKSPRPPRFSSRSVQEGHVTELTLNISPSPSASLPPPRRRHVHEHHERCEEALDCKPDSQSVPGDQSAFAQQEQKPVEFMLIGSVAFCVFMYYVTHKLVGSEIGAFIAGTLVSWANRRNLSRKGEETFASFHSVRNLFSALSFASAGMFIQPLWIKQHILTVLSFSAAVTLLKFGICFYGLRALHVDKNVARKAALGMAHVGEYAIVLNGQGTAAGLLSPSTSNLLLAATCSSILFCPVQFFISPDVQASPGLENKGTRQTANKQTNKQKKIDRGIFHFLRA